MTRFHRILFSALTLIWLAPVAVQAQQQEPDPGQGSPRRTRAAGLQRQRQHMAMLAQKLNLTDAQKEQFQQIGRDLRKQGMAVRQDGSLNDGQKREKMQALRKQAHQQMFGVLTPEQKDQLKQMREQHMKEQEKKSPGDQASGKKAGSAAGDDDDPFAGMTSDDDDGPENGSRF